MSLGTHSERNEEELMSSSGQCGAYIPSAASTGTGESCTSSSLSLSSGIVVCDPEIVFFLQIFEMNIFPLMFINVIGFQFLFEMV